MKADLDIDKQKWADELIEKLPNIEGVEKLPSIYFVGKAGSGKSYCAKFMIKKYGFHIAKFAYPVYMIAEKYFGMQTKDRKLLQIIGTEAGRDKINSEIWVTRFMEDMKIVRITSEKMGIPTPKFVMDDCRFPNERNVLWELGFYGIYLNVSDELRKSRLVGRDGVTQEDTFNHRSETLIDTFKDDLIQLDASGDLENCYTKLNQTLQHLVLAKDILRDI
jgi:dephospho-CoA kinase